MLRNIIASTLAATMLLACSSSTHNLSKGTCRDITLCDAGQCRQVNDSTTQSHCDMLGGTFEPVNHNRGWFDF